MLHTQHLCVDVVRVLCHELKTGACRASRVSFDFNDDMIS